MPTFLTLVAALLSSGVAAQSTMVRGIVVDPLGFVIPAVSVVVAPSDHSRAASSVFSAADGTFLVDAPGDGPYVVCLSAQAFRRRCLEHVVKGPQGSIDLGRIALSLDSDSGPVVVQDRRLLDPAAANTGRAFAPVTAPSAQQKPPLASDTRPSKDDLLRGGYGPYRANNDLLSYALDVRVDPRAKTIAGKNTVRFRMLADASRIQLDLVEALAIDRILLVDNAGRAASLPLHYEREERAVFIDFPGKLHTGQTYAIDFFYSGHPVEGGRFGGMTFKQDPAGRVWINTACEEEGASVWWPNKDQWRDEVESMDIRVAVPNDLTDVSNGRFVGKKDLGDGYTRWDWHVSYPINNYDVSLNIGRYVHFSDTHRGLTLDYYVLPENMDKAKLQFAQTPSMLDAYERFFGEYPFVRDGYKLIEVPYAGMEHQSAVAYGNHYANGYLNRDWTGIGISLRFDFILIHESGHEWFGNAVTAADRSDMWIHEGWTTYLECLYVEYMWGHEDEVAYVNALRKKVRNTEPILTARGQNREPPQDQYFKGALFLNTLRSLFDDDARWFATIHDFYQTFKYRTILTEDVVAFFTDRMGMEVKPVFDEYLRHAALPVLELRLDDAAGTLDYRWRAEEPGFAMPLRLSDHARIVPTSAWQTMKRPERLDAIVSDLEQRYYIDIDRQTPAPAPLKR